MFGMQARLGRRHTARQGLLLLACLEVSVRAGAQWLTQDIPLTPGWNAVFLRVQPEPAACEATLAGLPVAAVYRWSGSDQTLQFTASPTQLLPRADDWLVWMPPTHPQAGLNTLHALHANGAYLIRLAADAPPVTWQLKGRPRLFRHAWRADALNLCGLPVPPDQATFAGFLESCDALPVLRAQGGDIQAVNALGQGTPIWTPSRTKVEPGRAYWIRPTKSTGFTGPLDVETDFGDVLAFVPGKSERSLTLRNQTGSPMAVTLRLRPSEPSPAGDEYAVAAGPVPLSVREKDWSSGRPRTVYRLFDSPLTRTLAAGEDWVLPLVLREREMVADPPDSVRLGLIEITGGLHFQDTLGLIARR
jgi:hypothetical protein